MASSKLPGIPDSYALTICGSLYIFIAKYFFFPALKTDIALMDQLRLVVKTVSNITVAFHFLLEITEKCSTTNQSHKLHELLLPGIGFSISHVPF